MPRCTSLSYFTPVPLSVHQLVLTARTFLGRLQELVIWLFADGAAADGAKTMQFCEGAGHA